MICITMYNEPFSQLLESLAGVFRAYYELVDIDESYMDRVQICVIIDGYDKIGENFLQQCEDAGLYNAFQTKRFRSIENHPGKEEPQHVFKKLKFINEHTMNAKKRVYGTNTIIHCFSRSVKFPELLSGLKEEERNSFQINRYSIYDFLLGSAVPGKVKKRVFYHIPMTVHFCIKHNNQGKIESHKWFFKGFCQYMNPTYAQIID